MMHRMGATTVKPDLRPDGVCVCGCREELIIQVLAGMQLPPGATLRISAFPRTLEMTLAVSWGFVSLANKSMVHGA